jgi:hypothetical protein
VVVAAPVPDLVEDFAAEQSESLVCGAGGHGNAAEFVFCEECGESLGAAPEPIPAPVPAPVVAVAASGSDEASSLGSTAPAHSEASNQSRQKVIWGSIAAVAIGAVAVAAVFSGGDSGRGPDPDSGGTMASPTTASPASTAAPGTTSASGTTVGTLATSQADGTTQPPDAADFTGEGHIVDLSMLPEATTVGSCDDLSFVAIEFLEATTALASAMFDAADPDSVQRDMETLSALGDEYFNRSMLLGCSEQQMRSNLVALLPSAGSSDPLDHLMWGGLPDDEPLVDLRSQEVSGG